MMLVRKLGEKMSKKELLDELLKTKKGILKTSEVVKAGVSKPYFLEYVRNTKLEKVSQGIYIAKDAWNDEMFLLQARFPQVVFSHETALYLLDMAGREPLQFTITVKSGYHNDNLTALGVKVYSVKPELHEAGVVIVFSPNGHELRAYNMERTICDLIRSRSNVEIQDLQTAIKEYVKRTDKNLPLLMRYAKMFRIEKILRQYLEVLLT